MARKKEAKEPAPRCKTEPWKMVRTRRAVSATKITVAGDFVHEDGVLEGVPAGYYVLRIDGDYAPVDPETFHRDYYTDRLAGGVCCIVCGCTEDDACPGGCSWAANGLCSACARTLLARAGHDADDEAARKRLPMVAKAAGYPLP